jgi:hypothetical protein
VTPSKSAVQYSNDPHKKPTPSDRQRPYAALKCYSNAKLIPCLHAANGIRSGTWQIIGRREKGTVSVGTSRQSKKRTMDLTRSWNETVLNHGSAPPLELNLPTSYLQHVVAS